MNGPQVRPVPPDELRASPARRDYLAFQRECAANSSRGVKHGNTRRYTAPTVPGTRQAAQGQWRPSYASYPTLTKFIADSVPARNQLGATVPVPTRLSLRPTGTRARPGCR